MTFAFTASYLYSLRGVLVALSLGLVGSACKPRAHAPEAPSVTTPRAARAVPDPPAADLAPRAPAEDPFLLPEGETGDPAEAEEALRHDCCDEMPAEEVQKHVQPQAAPAHPVQARPERPR
jgi:hypothetical protein